MYDYLVFIGRFQPFHVGHAHIIEEARKRAHNVILIMGSHHKSPDIRNPLTSAERSVILGQAIDVGSDWLHLGFQTDHPYNETKWIAGIRSIVNTITMKRWQPDPISVGIIGYDKDHTTYYLRKFPEWPLVNIEQTHVINATTIRESIWYGSGVQSSWFVNSDHQYVTEKSLSSASMIAEYETIQKYQAAWANSPYPPVFSTVDAVVVHAGHVLLVVRKEAPGKNLLAMPGGFVNRNETIDAATLRELKEETSIDIPLPALVGSRTKRFVYDDPNRSSRGRTITHASLFRLNDYYERPKVRAGDDAADTIWLPLNELEINRSKIFEDHCSIIEHILGI